MALPLFAFKGALFMTLIDGALIAKKIEGEIALSISSMKKRTPGLAFVLVGDDPASRTYIKMKKKHCAALGMKSIDKELPPSIAEETLLEIVRGLNADPHVDGILIQLPLPPHISPSRIMESIDPKKDVDGFHPINVGKMLLGETDGFLPCTPQGILTLLSAYDIPVSGKHAVILGRSNIVGKPLAAILMQKAPGCNATVTVANSYTEHLKEICKSADILIAAMGQPQFITRNMVKEGAVVIDVGINRLMVQGRPTLVGDVDFEQVRPLCSHITPVPGGVGPMTIAMLMLNTFLSYEKRV
jgi:methylenetetrahydrofolate dehydrogenase (NADP+) / methenyltetrahydrofolate cyclohydrolase